MELLQHEQGSLYLWDMTWTVLLSWERSSGIGTAGFSFETS